MLLVFNCMLDWCSVGIVVKHLRVLFCLFALWISFLALMSEENWYSNAFESLSPWLLEDTKDSDYHHGFSSTDLKIWKVWILDLVENTQVMRLTILLTYIPGRKNAITFSTDLISMLTFSYNPHLLPPNIILVLTAQWFFTFSTKFG